MGQHLKVAMDQHRLNARREQLNKLTAHVLSPVLRQFQVQAMAAVAAIIADQALVAASRQIARRERQRNQTEHV